MREKGLPLNYVTIVIKNSCVSVIIVNLKSNL